MAQEQSWKNEARLETKKSPRKLEMKSKYKIEKVSPLGQVTLTQFARNEEKVLEEFAEKENIQIEFMIMEEEDLSVCEKMTVNVKSTFAENFKNTAHSLSGRTQPLVGRATGLVPRKRILG